MYCFKIPPFFKRESKEILIINIFNFPMTNIISNTHVVFQYDSWKSNKILQDKLKVQ